jgi:glucose-1-phosphate cytidylyltransferase
MTSPPKNLQAIILCGGKGERLRPLTMDLPKPLIPIKNKPILGYIVEHARTHAIGKLIVAAGYRADKIKDYFENHLKLAVDIVDSGEADIVRRITDCSAHIKGNFLVLYGDTLSDVDLDGLASFHRSRPEKATVTVWPLRSQFGLFEVAPDGKVLSFREKPVLDQWVNIGYFYFEQEALSWMRDFERFEDFLLHLAAQGEINAYRHRGVHITVNTLKELEEAEANIKYFQEKQDG